MDHAPIAALLPAAAEESEDNASSSASSIIAAAEHAVRSMWVRHSNNRFAFEHVRAVVYAPFGRFNKKSRDSSSVIVAVPSTPTT